MNNKQFDRWWPLVKVVLSCLYCAVIAAALWLVWHGMAWLGTA